MKQFRSFLLPLLLVLICLSGTLEGRQPPTAISTDGDPLKDETFVLSVPITAGKGFLSGMLGKALNLPKTVKINEIGFLANALSMDAIQAQPGDPKSFHGKVVGPYLKNSKEFSDSLKLRRTARQIKFQTISAMMKKVTELNDEQKQALLSFLSQQIGAPMVIFEKSPLPSFLPEPGPCMMPIGIELLEGKGGKRMTLETSAICVMDISMDGEVFFSVKAAVDNDTLDLVLCHENGHAIMFDMYGKKFAQIQRISTNGHDAPYVTDLGLGYIEGWAEAFEAVYGPANPKLKEKDRKKYNISEFLFGRQDPIRRDRYIWARPTGKKTGVLKNGLQLMCTEGVVAGQFYDLLTSRALTGAFEKSVSTMLMAQPQSYPEFIKAFTQFFPDDKKLVYRMFLENMNYVPMSAQAARLYKDYYQAKLGYVQKRIQKEQFEQARQAYVSFKEDLFKQAMNGADIFANIGPEMWFSGVLKIEKEKKSESLSWKEKLAKKSGKKDMTSFPFNLDLNTITAKGLVTIGFAEEDAEKIILERENKGFFTGDPLQKLEELVGRQKFLDAQTKSELQKFKSGQAATVEGQSIAMWPEDIEKLD